MTEEIKVGDRVILKVNYISAQHIIENQTEDRREKQEKAKISMSRASNPGRRLKTFADQASTSNPEVTHDVVVKPESHDKLLQKCQEIRKKLKPIDLPDSPYDPNFVAKLSYDLESMFTTLTNITK